MEDETGMGWGGGGCWDLCVESMFRGVVGATGRLKPQLLSSSE